MEQFVCLFCVWFLSVQYALLRLFVANMSLISALHSPLAVS